MSKTIKVMGAKVDDKTILWETHPDHPAGEIFIAGNGTAVEVAETPRIAALIKDGTLVKVTTNQPEPKASEPEATKKGKSA